MEPNTEAGIVLEAPKSLGPCVSVPVAMLLDLAAVSGTAVKTLRIANEEMQDDDCRDAADELSETVQAVRNWLAQH